MQINPRTKKLAAILLGLTLTAAACGSDDQASTETDTAESTVSDDGEMVDEEMMDDESMDEESMDGEMMDSEMMGDQPVLHIDFEGLEPLGDDYEYEAWVIVDDEPVSGGIFDVADDGSLDIATGDHLYGHEDASAVVITIEPAVGDDPAPADTHVLAGDIAEDGSFDLSISHPAALGTDFADASGSYILATPTDDDAGNELSGVWFITVPGPEAGLDLPELPAGWVYEGWAVIDGNPVSTGRFTDPTIADDFSGFSGPNDGPPFPGEDFLVDAPEGVEFPTDLTSATIVISVEPDADNSPAPFALKPLLSVVPGDAATGMNLELGVGSVAVGGSGTNG